MKGAHHKQFRCPPFDLLNFTQNKEAHKRTEETPSFWRRHTMFKQYQKSEGSDRPTHSHYSLSLHFSQHIPLLKSHSPSMLRERLKERGYRRCARNPQKKTCPHFLRTHHHHCSKQGFSGSHAFTCLSAQEKSHCPKGILFSQFRLGCRGRVQPPSHGPNKDKHLSTAVCPTSLAPCLSPLGRKSLKTTTSSSLSLSLPPSSAAILAQAISCSNVRGGFSRRRAFLVLTCPSVYNSVLLFPICSHGACWRWVKRAYISFTSYFEFRFSWWFRPWSRRNGSSLIWRTTQRGSRYFVTTRAGIQRLGQTLKTFWEAVGIVTSRITDAELIVNTLSAKMASFAEMEQNVSALSQNVYFSSMWTIPRMSVYLVR